MDLERALTKLRYDDEVSGYALITNDGEPFLSFSLPEEILPSIRGAMKIHSTSLKLMNIMAGPWTVVLARVNPDWVLATVFAEVQLGIALQKTRDVVRLLEQVKLPPPPSARPAESAAEVPTTAEAPGATEPALSEEPAVAPAKKTRVTHGCVVHRGPRYAEAMRLGSELNHRLRDLGAFAIDVLLLVDEERTVFKIAETLARSVDKVIEVVRWSVSNQIVTVECPEEQESGERVIVEVPIFEGELSKAKAEHRPVLELCKGELTLNEIANQLGMTYFEAMQCILPYRGKTLRFVSTSRVVS